MDFIILTLAYLALGGIAGLLAGLLGVGGGLIMVPGLYWILSHQGVTEGAMHIAIATSMAVIIPTGFMSARSHAKRGGVEWALWRRWLPGVIGGVVGGTLIVGHMDTDSLRIFFGLALLALASLLLWTPHEGDHKKVPDHPLMMLPLGAGIGIVSAMAGIGGATLSVPAMRWMGRPLPRAIGTASALGVAIAIPACAMYLVLAPEGVPKTDWVVGSVHLKAAACLALASMPMAPLGAKLTHTLPVRTVKIIFVCFMAFVSLKLLTEGLL